MAKEAGIDELTQEASKLTLEEKPDEYYYGLYGLRPDTKLYRVCTDDQDTNKDIVCKALRSTEEAKRTVNKHINSGSKFPSRFISTTALYDVAKDWASNTKEDPKNVVPRPGGPLPIIEIDLSRMTGMKELNDLINLTNQEVRTHFVSGATQINRVKSSEEVLFQWRIPKKNASGEDVFVLYKPIQA